MSNMLYACSILYKTKLPMILVFNKTDVQDAEFAKEWMTDFDAFQQALREEEEGGSFGQEGGIGGSGYMSSLLNSMSLMLEEFYRHLNVVGVSSMTGDGIDDFFKAVEEKRQEFERDYRPELERKKKEREEAKESNRELELGKLMKDMSVSGSTRSRRREEEAETVSEAEEEEEARQKDEEFGLDDSDDDEAPTADDEGLSERYQQAMSDSRAGPSDGDHSFARYLGANRINQ